MIVEQSMNHTLSVRTKDWKYIEPNDDPTTFMKAEKNRDRKPERSPRYMKWKR